MWLVSSFKGRFGHTARRERLRWRHGGGGKGPRHARDEGWLYASTEQGNTMDCQSSCRSPKRQGRIAPRAFRESVSSANTVSFALVASNSVIEFISVVLSYSSWYTIPLVSEGDWIQDPIDTKIYKHSIPLYSGRVQLAFMSREALQDLDPVCWICKCRTVDTEVRLYLVKQPHEVNTPREMGKWDFFVCITESSRMWQFAQDWGFFLGNLSAKTGESPKKQSRVVIF